MGLESHLARNPNPPPPSPKPPERTVVGLGFRGLRASGFKAFRALGLRVSGLTGFRGLRGFLRVLGLKTLNP